MIEEALFSILRGNSGIVNYVGDRIRPVQLPLDCELPAISYTVISDPYKQIAGYPRIQISVFSESYNEAKMIAGSLNNLLTGFSGIVNGTRIIRIVPLDSYDRYDASPEKLGVYHIPTDYKVIYRKNL